MKSDSLTMQQRTFRKGTLRSAIASLAALAMLGAPLHAATIAGGSTTFTLKKDNPGVSGLYQFEDYFDDTVPYNYIINWNSAEGRQNNSGNLSYTTTTINGETYVVLVDPIRPDGTIATPQQGRKFPITNLQFDTENFTTEGFLSQWGTATVDPLGMFVTYNDASSLIALTNMTRWKPFGSSGSLINGDFALLYDPTRADDTRSGLVLGAHADSFAPFVFADLANVSIAYNASNGELSIVGDILIAGGVTYWDGFTTSGLNIGTFEMTATTFEAVPEPTTWATLIAGTTLLAFVGRRRRKAS